MRGKRRYPPQVIHIIRITPADAGKTLSERVRIRSCWDHPRGCGENVARNNTDSRKPGSPPRMRGKPVAKQLRHRRVGITPADAGKTLQYALQHCAVQDHPRGCGENCFLAHPASSCTGSPPRMRGKLNFSCSLLGVTRITPADAGKTRQNGKSASSPGITPADAGKT